jgi:hypothetical protein
VFQPFHSALFLMDKVSRIRSMQICTEVLGTTLITLPNIPVAFWVR